MSFIFFSASINGSRRDTPAISKSGEDLAVSDMSPIFLLKMQYESSKIAAFCQNSPKSLANYYVRSDSLIHDSDE
jgi:hypothetical protein